ncbi:DUF3025 domain-containing protein [Paraglaciecola aestuariivivens]
MKTWHHAFIQQLSMLPMQQLEQVFALSQFQNWPNAEGLNALKHRLMASSKACPEFICQNQLAPTEQYYEQIIFEQGLIPTRPNNWHDLFNGLIWLQFPKTKALLNKLHVEDIQEYGLSPRTLRRNNITHFDECGVVLTYQQGSEAEQLIAELKQHNWQLVLLKNRHLWGKQLNSFMFGHANLEMLLQPFIGLTGKWLALEVTSEFAEIDYQQKLHELDKRLTEVLNQQNLMANKKPLMPLPLLGIPGVWDANQDPSFYDNTDYFRPKSKFTGQ